MFRPDHHDHNPEKRKNPERVDGKSDDRIMNRRIIFEDGWMMMAWSRDSGMDSLAGRLSILRIQ